LREIAIQIAIAVGKQAYSEGLTTGATSDGVVTAVHEKMWSPRYRRYRRAGSNE
jgi:malic enzyme